MSLPPGALSHLRVLDLTRVLAGPWCTQLLADLGADVIKVERPGVGDDTRAWGPPYLRDGAGEETSEAAYYLAANRNKRSITVDIAHPEGQAIVRRLAAQSDIVVENYKFGQLARYGLDYATLSRSDPRLIYCSITGFGQTGPHRELPGYDFIIQACGGFMSITGERDDQPGGGPQKAGVAVSDLMTGMYACTAILAAVAHRERSGSGQYVDLALYDVMVAMLANMNMNYLTTGRAPGRAGNAHPNIVPYQVFAAADGQLVIAVGNDAQFVRFCEVAGVPELAADARYARNADRVRHRDALVPVLSSLVRARPLAFWLEALDAAGVPCGPINDIAQALADPQVAARGLRVDLPHPLAGSVPLVANPIQLSATPAQVRRAPPLLGEHTEEVLLERLGMTDADIARLRRAGAL
ncbi:MAG: CoA transferase [Burkholderiaceae bacterium]|jgi:crotonobetainyl-CoA:carnitine CoA-transferase CaiB-like acyl-CoA transferase|nr:CoA transferase [Burkholderiaceae bacterium]